MKLKSKEFQENLKVKKALKKQLKDFQKSNNYFSLYTPYRFDTDVYLLRMFRFLPPEQFRTTSTILRPSTVMGNNNEFEVATEWDDSVVFPIAKVIKSGIVLTSQGEIDVNPYEQGDLVLLYPDRVLGKGRNPEFEAWRRYKEGEGYQVLGPPPPVEVANIQLNYASRRFVRLGNYTPDEEDLDTYLLHSHEVQGEFDLKEYLKIV